MAAQSSRDSVVGVREREPLHLRHRLAHDDRLRRLAERPDHFHVLAMAHEHDRVAVAGVLERLQMHLRDQRAGGVERAQPALARLGAHRGRHAVRRKDDHGAVRHVREVVREHRALPAQVLDHVAVVHDLVPHVDGRAVDLERHVDDVDGAVDAGAESTRRGEPELAGRSGHGIAAHASARAVREPVIARL